MSQKSRILAHLKNRPITPLVALKLYGCLRLAARIADLRDSGHDITTTLVKRSDSRVAEYRLA